MTAYVMKNLYKNENMISLFRQYLCWDSGGGGGAVRINSTLKWRPGITSKFMIQQGKRRYKYHLKGC